MLQKISYFSRGIMFFVRKSLVGHPLDNNRGHESEEERGEYIAPRATNIAFGSLVRRVRLFTLSIELLKHSN